MISQLKIKKKEQTHDYNRSKDCFNLKEKIKFFQEIQKRWFPDYYVEKVRKGKGKQN